MTVPEMRSRFVTVMGRELHYLEWAPVDCEAERTVVCVHGLARTAHDFNELGVALSSHPKIRARVIAFDVLGRGLSQWAPVGEPEEVRDSTAAFDSGMREYSIPHYVDLLVAALRSESVGVKHPSVDWVGTSMGGIIGWNAAARAMAPPPTSGSAATEKHATPYIARLLLNDVGPLLNPVALQRILKYVTFELKTATQREMGEILRATYAPFGPQRDAWYERMLRVQTRRLPDGAWTTHFDPRVMRALLFNNPVADVVAAELDAATPLAGPLDGSAFDTRHWGGDAVAAAGASAEESQVPWAAFDAVRAPILLVHGADSDLLQPVGVAAMGRRKEAQRKQAGAESRDYNFETHVVSGVGHAPTLNDDAQIGRVVEFLSAPGL